MAVSRTVEPGRSVQPPELRPRSARCNRIETGPGFPGDGDIPQQAKILTVIFASSLSQLALPQDAISRRAHLATERGRHKGLPDAGGYSRRAGAQPARQSGLNPGREATVSSCLPNLWSKLRLIGIMAA